MKERADVRAGVASGALAAAAVTVAAPDPGRETDMHAMHAFGLPAFMTLEDCGFQMHLIG
jgi:hypothetical protein